MRNDTINHTLAVLSEGYVIIKSISVPAPGDSDQGEGAGPQHRLQVELVNTRNTNLSAAGPTPRNGGPHADLPDESLMMRLQEGDDLALNALMARWEKPLIGFIARSTGNRSDAIDLAQETFVKIYEKRSRFRTGGKFSTWMFAIAVNLCRNLARWKSRHPSVSTGWKGADGEEGDWMGSLADPGEGPDRSAMLDDEAKQIRDALQTLPHDLKTAVLLFEFEGMSHAEIAEVQRCSPKAVETRLYRARQLLRKQLQSIYLSA